MKIRESGEDYLEAILIITNENGYVKGVDIAKRLKVSKPSVSRAVSILKKAGHIIVTEHLNIELTPTGLELAKSINERHRFLSMFFMSLGVSKKTAELDACKAEHILSEETLSKLKEYFDER